MTVATTSTPYGADLLVSGTVAAGTEVRKYGLAPAGPGMTTVEPKLLTTLPTLPDVSGAVPLAGR